ncbi:MAG: PAS domain S-box protein [Chloroflexi bacterium]|nr:MAG: PAS domain S-box protein [Chloroflexota bacterium]
MIQHIFTRLTEPHPAVKNPDERQQAQLLASLLLLLIPLGFVVSILQAVFEKDTSIWADPEVQQMVVILGFVSGMYVLSRTKYYRAMIFIVILGIIGIIFFMSFPEHQDDSDVLALYYLVIPVLFSVVFLSLKWAFFVAVLCTTAVAIYPAITGIQIAPQPLVGPFSFLLIVNSTTLLVGYYRNRLEALRKEEVITSQARLQAIFDNANIGIGVVDRNGRFLQVNQRWASLLEYTPEELSQMSYIDITHPEDIEASRANLEALIRGEIDAYRLEKQFVSKSGRIFWGDLSVTPIYDKNGQLEACIGLITDITTRKTAEAEREQLLQELLALTHFSHALRYSNTVDEMLPTILEHATLLMQLPVGGIFLFDPDSHDLILRAFWPATLQLPLLRCQSDQSLSKVVATMGQIRIIHDIRQDPLLQPVRDAIPQAIKGLQTVISMPLRTQTETIGVMHLGTFEHRVFSEREQQLLVTFSDIAANALFRASVQSELEQRIAERTHELIEANKKLKTLDLLKSQFIENISHELRTPLTNLHLYQELLENGPEEKRPHYMSVLRETTSQLIRLAEDILTVSQLELFKDQVTFSEVYLDQVAARVVASYQSQAREAGLEMCFRNEAPLPPVQGNEQQLTEVVRNLVKNSLNFTKNGRIQITTGTTPDQKHICLRIQDTGTGIHPDDLPYIFDRFYRGQNALQSNIRGTGLGLAIVRDIVELHNGTIEIESKPDYGSTITVKLPITPPHNGTTKQPHTQASPHNNQQA